MISCSSCLASSQPATSLNVTLGVLSSSTRAFVFPNLSAALPPACIWRSRNSQAPKIITSGSQVNSTDSQLTPAVRTSISMLGLVCHTFSGRPWPSPRMLVLKALNVVSWGPTCSVDSFLSSPLTARSTIWRLAMLPLLTSSMNRVYEISTRCGAMKLPWYMR